MGGQLSKEKDFDEEEEIDLVSKEEVLGLGKVIIYRDESTGGLYIRLSTYYAINNKELVESEINALRRLDSIRNYSPLVHFSVEKSKLLCYDNYILNLTFNHYQQSFQCSILESQIDQEEDDLWLITEDLCSLLSEMKGMGLNHGDLQPKFLYFNKNRIVKVLCPLIYTTYGDAYRLRLANDDYHSTFSPELLEAYSHRETNPSVDLVKSDIFSLGISLLSFINRCEYTHYYNFKSNRVLFDNVRQTLKSIVDKGYSEELFFLLNSCLKEISTERASIESLERLFRARNEKKGRERWL